MALALEQYALIGDCHTAALVGSDGSIDWLCLPRFDSPACFAALLGDADNGQWALAPTGRSTPAGRRYRGDSLVLETDLATDAGRVRITDFMPVRSAEESSSGSSAAVVRVVTSLDGEVELRSTIRLAFDHGTRQPLWRDGASDGAGVVALAGPDAVTVDGDVRHEHRDGRAEVVFLVRPGTPVTLRLTWHGLSAAAVPRLTMTARRTQQWWCDWAATCDYDGPYRDVVVRSLLTLKALTYAPSGGMVAAVTTSLPEQLGGPRNWDYRYCWIRDATFTLLALLEAGYRTEAAAWREWLVRALGGDPSRLQIMYGIGGEQRLTETTLDLPGYADSRPVRVGNAASEQFQLDVYGELMDSLHQARRNELAADEDAWSAQRALMDVLEGCWQQPDKGIWEMRGQPQHYVHSKVMAWVAADRAIAAVERSGLPGPVEAWKRLRHDIHREVCDRGFDGRRNSFVQSYGSTALDASLLLIPAVGFLPIRDPRVQGTIAAIERHLMQEGLLVRYDTGAATVEDGLPPGEGAFLPCTFWLADAHAMAGRPARARHIYERLLRLSNDVGLFTEEYDVSCSRAVGNLPQALTHVAVVNTAYLLHGGGASRRRASSRSRSRS
jgi:GH15 family glucan-1,4-alpha-glucosidase